MTNDTLLPGASAITKGEVTLPVLSEADVIRLLDPAVLIDGLAEGFRAQARGHVQCPDRVAIDIPQKGFSLSMPAWIDGGPIAVKVVNVFEGNLALGLPNHLALISLFDPQTGMPLCVMDGTAITGLRTAASAILSVRELARRDARTVTLIGAGVQGREHLRLLSLIGDFDEICIASYYPEDAERLAEGNPVAVAVADVEAAVRRSDIVCLASHSYTPVIEADWIRSGTHVSSVGYAPPAGELPSDLIARARLFVESRDAFKSPPVGCGELTGLDPDEATELGDILAGVKPGRQSADEITLYKAMGIAMEDLVAATIVYQNAIATGSGKIAAL